MIDETQQQQAEDNAPPSTSTVAEEEQRIDRDSEDDDSNDDGVMASSIGPDGTIHIPDNMGTVGASNVPRHVGETRVFGDLPPATNPVVTDAADPVINSTLGEPLSSDHPDAGIPGPGDAGGPADLAQQAPQGVPTVGDGLPPVDAPTDTPTLVTPALQDPAPEVNEAGEPISESLGGPVDTTRSMGEISADGKWYARNNEGDTRAFDSESDRDAYVQATPGTVAYTLPA